MGDNALAGLLPGGSASLFFYSEPFDEKWSKCELITAGLIQGIQPSRQSEGKRRAIIDYVERLIQRHFNCQVSTYGSVPLKTYLPDGDIDLSTFSWLPHSSELWANELRHLLKHEEHIKHAKFCVREVQIINAEVQIVKCLVDNVIVDISFNQLGGICTLCFLEKDFLNIRDLLSSSCICIGLVERMDGNKEEGSCSEDRQPIPIAHEIGESSGQAEKALQVVTAVTMFKQLMENPRFMEFIQSSSIAHQVQGSFGMPGTVFRGMQGMVPIPMYANIGLHPGFQGTQGQFGVSQGNVGMAGFFIPPENMTPRHQHVTGQGV
ncbi:hypothetical protein L7F22_041891 [Adiantum nelumboides]|nr:hypothetical protein [Adiantum nelumboides]